jgi:transcriptional regulator with XRE-family HTH domain
VLDESFAAMLRRLRERAGLTQEQLAEQAGLSANAVSSLERGTRKHPYPHTVRVLAEALALKDDDRTALERTIGPRGKPRQLPSAPSAVLGRDDEMRTVTELLATAQVRLLTLTGPGGVGKTRLALATAERLAGDFPDGAAFVSLAALADPGLVVPIIAEALGLRELGSHPLREMLHTFLRGRRMLLVLDNLEHLPGASEPIADLLMAAGRPSPAAGWPSRPRCWLASRPNRANTRQCGHSRSHWEPVAGSSSSWAMPPAPTRCCESRCESATNWVTPGRSCTTSPISPTPRPCSPTRVGPPSSMVRSTP